MASEEQQLCAVSSFQKTWSRKGKQKAAAQRILLTFVSSIRGSDTCHAAGTALDASIQVMPFRALKLLYMKATSEAFEHRAFAPVGKELTGPLKHSVCESAPLSPAHSAVHRLVIVDPRATSAIEEANELLIFMKRIISATPEIY